MFAFWKHKKEGHVIDDESHAKLPVHHKNQFERTDAKPTHQVKIEPTPDRSTEDSDSSLLTGLIVYEALSNDSSSNDSSPDTGSSTDNSSSSSDFSGGGGDTGGGGASGSW